MKRCLTALVAVLATLAVGPPARATPSRFPISGDGFHRSTPDLAAALHVVERAVENHPDVLGYPYIDHTAGEVVVRYTTAAGRNVADRVRNSLPAPSRDEAATTSVAGLTQLRDDLIRLGRDGVPGARTIWRLEPDREHNRVTVTVTQRSDTLLAELAHRYPAADITVRVRPRPQPPILTSRTADGLPFSGGALVITPADTNCTLGFAWSTGVVTAGHCAPRGGTFASTTNAWLGTVTPDREENFDDGYGTTYLPGQHVYRGDVALIRTTYAQPKIYLGDPGSNRVASVAGMWSRPAETGDQFCTGGAISGELCGWTVRSTEISILTDFWHWEWVNNVVEGDRIAPGCLEPGDSGGPVYTVRRDGTVSAKGIVSSSASERRRCWAYFTDIWDAYYALPGALATG